MEVVSLSDRKQFVQIPGGISECGQVSSGVPQGVVLGPVFFLILIADITKNVNSLKSQALQMATFFHKAYYRHV